MKLLQLHWLTGTARGCTDLIPLSVMEADGFEGLHRVIKQAEKSWRPYAFFRTTRVGRAVTLDYHPFAAENEKQGMDAGNLRLHFGAGFGRLPTALSWNGTALRLGTDVAVDFASDLIGHGTVPPPGVPRPRRADARAFRDQVVMSFGGRCCVSGCTTESALEAAHIRPYNGHKSNKLSNGLALRADLHRLFDADLLAVEPGTLTIHLAPEVAADPVYSVHAGTTLLVPPDAPYPPDAAALLDRWRRFRPASRV